MAREEFPMFLSGLRHTEHTLSDTLLPQYPMLPIERSAGSPNNEMREAAKCMNVSVPRLEPPAFCRIRRYISSQENKNYVWNCGRSW